MTPTIFAAHNVDSETRRHSSSGGIFAMLANDVIGAGGVVYGATIDANGNVAHRRVDNTGALAALQGSKYVFSDATKAYADACADIAAGRHVLFCGTPCQTAAMRQRAGDNPALLLVEVVCHGAPQPKYWRRYLAETVAKHRRSIADIARIDFRDKRTGWKNYSFTILYRDGKTVTQLHDDNLWMRAFLGDLTLRDACFRCPFKYPDGSAADITLGDLWGIERLAPDIDNDLGTTLVIARTRRGKAAVANIAADATLTLADVARYNPALTTSATKPAGYDTFRNAAQTLLDNTAPTKQTFRKLAARHTARPLLLTLKIRLARLLAPLRK